MPFWRWYLATIAIGQLLLAVLNLVPAVLIEPGRFHTDYYLKTLPFGAVLFPIAMLPGMLFYVLFWTVRIAPDGLRAADKWGRYATVSWHSITEVKPVPLPLIPFARVRSTETRRELWLPLFMRNFERYARLVEEYAGEGHPVARELAKRLDDS